MGKSSLDNQPGFELPQPSVESNLPPLPQSEAPVHSEQVSKQAELPGRSLPPIPAQTVTDYTQDDNGGTPDPIPAVSATATTQFNNPDIADDVDLIEKEWVDKAKSIVEQTREDPHQQNKQLNQFKADYMKKRYGKEIRLSEE